jgi:hypothetical protein
MHARMSFSELCPSSPRSCIVSPSHFRASQASPGLRGRPHRWWKISAVSMQRGCEGLGNLDPIRANDPARSSNASVRQQASLLAPQPLSQKSLDRREKDSQLPNLPREIIGDWTWWFEKSIAWIVCGSSASAGADASSSTLLTFGISYVR